MCKEGFMKLGTLTFCYATLYGHQKQTATNLNVSPSLHNPLYSDIQRVFENQGTFSVHGANSITHSNIRHCTSVTGVVSDPASTSSCEKLSTITINFLGCPAESINMPADIVEQQNFTSYWNSSNALSSSQMMRLSSEHDGKTILFDPSKVTAIEVKPFVEVKPSEKELKQTSFLGNVLKTFGLN